MSNPLVKMRELQAQMQAFEQEIQELQANPQLKAELLFESEFKELLNRHGKSIHEAVLVVDPSYRLTMSSKTRKPYTKQPPKTDAQGQAGEKRERNSQPIYYLFTNPHTGQAVRSANILKKEVQEWIGQYGKDTVLTWRELAPTA